MTKTCSKCGIEKSIDEFSRDASSHSKDGRQYHCLVCGREYKKQWQIKRQASYRKSTQKTMLKQKYGLTLPDLHNQLVLQDGKCKICSKPISFEAAEKRDKPHVDHDHVSYKFRGLL